MTAVSERPRADHLLVRIPEGGYLPRGYGAAWFDWETGTVMTAPVPLNRILGWLRRTWIRLQQASGVRDPLGAAYLRGYGHGCARRDAEAAAPTDPAYARTWWNN